MLTGEKDASNRNANADPSQARLNSAYPGPIGLLEAKELRAGMRRAATVLILGDPGPIRDEILLRKEIDVVWSESFQDALELLEVYRVEACILAPAFEQMSGYEGFRARLGPVPCLVIRDLGCAEGEVGCTEPVLRFLARHTGLVFARYPRAQLRVPVTVEVAQRKYLLRTTNLSVSGVAIDRFPEVAPGTRAELCIDLPERPLYLLARVVRCRESGEGRQAGLSFTDLGEVPRMVLTRAVERALPVTRDGPLLFGELEIPLPSARRLGEPAEPRRAHEGRSLEPSMRKLAETDTIGLEPLPSWFEGLEEELTEVERLAALGHDAPEWAHRVLRLRVELARARSELTGEVPLALRDEAYRTFVGIGEETVDAPVEVQEQVSSIRASLLRDVLGETVGG